jgi:hypothetical protein
VGSNCGWDIAEGCVVYADYTAVEDGDILIDTGGVLWNYDFHAHSLACYDGTVLGWGESDFEIIGSAADGIPLQFMHGSIVRDIKFVGGRDISSSASPMISFDGAVGESVNFDLTGHDRGAGELILLDNGANIKMGATASGDNSNAGGHGLAARRGSSCSLPAGHALTGNSGGTTTAYLGSLGLTAYPASGNSKNDLPASPNGSEELARLDVR